MRVAVIIPVLNEATTIGTVVAAIPSSLASCVVVVDGGSVDGTAARASQAGARVIVERRRGYGRACLSGVEEAERLGAEIVAFLDGDGSDDPSDLTCVVGPIVAGEADFVLGARSRTLAERGALRPIQRLGNRVATTLVAALHGHRYSDLGPMRALRIGALRRLTLDEAAHGWPIAMQIDAPARGLRVREVPVRSRRRAGGRSKVSGDLRGSLRAGLAILRVILTRRP